MGLFRKNKNSKLNKEMPMDELFEVNSRIQQGVTNKLNYIGLSHNEEWILEFKGLVKERQLEIEKGLLNKLEDIVEELDVTAWKEKIQQFIANLISSDLNHDFILNQKPIIRMLLETKLQPDWLIGAGEIVLDDIVMYLMQTSSWSKVGNKIRFYHKWMMLHQMVWVELYTKEVVSTFSHGVSELVFYNAQIDQIKDLIAYLEKQVNFSNDIQHMVEEINTSFEEVASSSNSAASFTQQSVEEVKTGQKVIKEALQEMGTLDQTYKQMIEGMEKFSQRINEMQSMIELIRDVAEQTNLLALNANIEAARAGEQGLGFAVVAQEVRKLSENSRKSVDKITEMMDGLTSEANNMKNWMEETGAVVQNGVNESTQAIDQLEAMVDKISQINHSINEIAAANQEQSSAIGQVSVQNEQIVELASLGKDKGLDTGKAIYQLSMMSQQIRKSIDEIGIQVTEKEILNLAKTDHLLWKWKIYNMLLGFEVVEAESIQNEKECRLGRWYYQEGAAYKHLEIYQKMEQPHQMVHQTAKEAAIAYQDGNIQKAEEKLLELEKYSEAIIMMLQEIEGTIED